MAQTTLTNYTVLTGELLQASIFDAAGEMPAAYGEECLEKYIAALTEAFDKHGLTILGNGEILGEWGGNNPDRDQLKEIIDEVDMNSDYEDIFARHAV